MSGRAPCPAGLRLLGAVVGYSVLAYALDRLPPSRKAITVVLVVVALLAALAGARARPFRGPRWAAPLALAGLLAMVLWELWLLPRRSLDLSSRPIAAGLRDLVSSPAAPLTAIVALAVVAVSYGWRGMPGARWRFPAALALCLFISAWALTIRPRPNIDVLLLEDNACATLLRGENPYAARTHNPYPSAPYLPLEVLRDGEILGFPYPPLTLLALVPGYLAGDVRWSLVAAVLVTAAFMVAAGRRLGLPAGHPAELAAIAFLLHPRGLMVVERGWTEPLLALAASAAAWAVAARRPRVGAAALGALVTLKQTGLLGAVALARVLRPRMRDALPAALVAGAVIAAFVAWDPAGAWRSLVSWHARSPFRADSLSIPAVLMPPDTFYLSPGEQFGLGAAGLAAAGAVLWAALARGDGSASSAALATAAGLLAFFLLNKAAHMNYYWWAGSYLPLAAVCAAGECATGTSVAMSETAALE